MYGLFVLIIYFSRDVIIFTVIVDKHDSRNATMKKINILEQKSMKKKEKVSSTTNEGETENYSQLSTLEFNITKKISSTMNFIPVIFSVPFFFVQ